MAWPGLINSHLFSRLTKSESAVTRISHIITHLGYRCVVSCFHACRTPVIFGRCSSAHQTTELLNNLCPVRYNISRCNLRRLCFGYLISYLHAKCNPSMMPRFNSNYCTVHRGRQHVKNYRSVHCTEAGVEGLVFTRSIRLVVFKLTRDSGTLTRD